MPEVQLPYRRGAGPTLPRKQCRCLHSNLLLDRRGQSAWRYRDRREHQSLSGWRRNIAAGSGQESQTRWARPSYRCPEPMASQTSRDRSGHVGPLCETSISRTNWTPCPDRRRASGCPPAWPVSPLEHREGRSGQTRSAKCRPGRRHGMQANSHWDFVHEEETRECFPGCRCYPIRARALQGMSPRATSDVTNSVPPSLHKAAAFGAVRLAGCLARANPSSPCTI